MRTVTRLTIPKEGGHSLAGDPPGSNLTQKLALQEEEIAAGSPNTLSEAREELVVVMLPDNGQVEAGKSPTQE